MFMKKNYFLLYAIFCAASLFGQSQANRALVIKKGATWCEPSGTWGWTAHNTIVSQNQAQSEIIQIFPSTSSGMYSPFAIQLEENFGQTIFTPEWFVNGINETEMVGSSVNLTQTIANVRSAVLTTYNTPALVNSAYSMTTEPVNATITRISATTKTKFFAPATGDYYLSAFVIENDVVANQLGFGPNAVHTNVFRWALSTTAFGQPLASGSIAAGTEISLPLTKLVSNGALDLSDIYLLLVIWEKVGDTYHFVNSSRETLTLATQDFKSSDFSFAPNPVNDVLTITCRNHDTASVKVTNMNGQQCLEMVSFTDEYRLDTSSLSAGIYFMNVTQDGRSETFKVVKR